MDKIKKIDDDWLEYAKDYMKVRFSSDDNLPLNKQLKFYSITKLLDVYLVKIISFIHNYLQMKLCIAYKKC